MSVASRVLRMTRGLGKRLNPLRYFPPAWYVWRHRDLRDRFAGLDLSRGPTLVLGSAPGSIRPAGIDGSWVLLTANASQKRLVEWNLPGPDLTVMRSNASAAEALQEQMWAQIKGLRTKRMFSAGRPQYGARIAEVARQHSYQIDETILANWTERLVIIYFATGLWFLGRNPQETPTNGILAILLAAWLGSQAIVISGFSFSKGGYFYDSAGSAPVARERPDGDRAAIRALLARGAPLFCSDPGFAAESGIPLWDDVTAQRVLAERFPQRQHQ